MNRKNVCVGMLFALAAMTAHSATITIMPPVVTTLPDKQLQLDFEILGDFGDTLVAGGTVDVTWSPFLLHGDVAPRHDLPGQDSRFNVGFLRSRPFRPLPGDPPSGRETFGFGSLTGMHIPAGTPIGHLRLFARGPDGTTPISISDSIRGAGFFDITGAPIDVDYVGTSATTIAVVPLPAAGWLLLSALGGMLGLHWRNAKRGQQRRA